MGTAGVFLIMQPWSLPVLCRQGEAVHPVTAAPLRIVGAPCVVVEAHMDAVLHCGQLEREVERRPGAEGHDWRIERGQLEGAVRIAVAKSLRHSVHAAAAPANYVRRTYRLGHFLDLPSV